MWIFPTTEALATPSISRTAHSISAPSIAFSIIAFGSKPCASVMAAASASIDLTFVVPREDPPRAGFTNTGSPSASTSFVTPALLASHSDFFTTIPGAVAMPWELKIGFAKDLSIATAEAKTPDPT